MLTTKELLIGYGEEKENASNEELEMPIYGSKFGKNYMTWQKGALEVEHVKAHGTKKKKKR